MTFSLTHFFLQSPYFQGHHNYQSPLPSISQQFSSPKIFQFTTHQKFVSPLSFDQSLIIIDFRFARYNYIEIIPLSPMLKNLALIISNPRYEGLIILSDSSFIIENQYSFLWNVLPKVTGKFTRRAQFAKQMRQFGFEVVEDRSVGNKQNNQEKEKEGEKRLVFLAKSKESLYALKKIQANKEKRREEKSKLEEKMKNLSSAFLSLKNGTVLNPLREFQLFDEISSLKNINRDIFILNEQMSELLDQNFQIQQVKLYQETTFEMLNQCANVVNRNDQKGRLYSMQVLEYYGQ